MAPPKNVFEAAAAHAAAYVQSVAERPIGATATVADLRTRLGGTLPQTPSDPVRVIDDLVHDVDGGIIGSTNPRFFGWVIGGTLPVALAADWLTSTWDQNAASNVTAPAEAVIEEVCGDWLKQLLGLPASASFGFVTGCQMAHTTAFAAARHKLLRDRQWDVESKGLSGAPRLRVLTTESRHESIIRTVRLLGIGSDAIRYVAADADGRMNMAALEQALRAEPDVPTVVSLQAGDLNTGIFDPFDDACTIASDHRAWVHVDGAFGLWAAVSDTHRHHLAGVERADSWATDGHKWLNLPFDSGFVFVADASAHSAPFVQHTSYSTPLDELRNQKDWNPEWSRRARAVPAYAAIRALGRSGIADIVDRCCAHAEAIVAGIGALPGAEILSRPVINQGLVRFRSPDGTHDARTDAVIRNIQAEGAAWFGGVTWRGQRAMRVSVCNWATSERDVDRTIAAVRAAIAATTAD